jgi:hypothetical protein
MSLRLNSPADKSRSAILDRKAVTARVDVRRTEDNSRRAVRGGEFYSRSQNFFSFPAQPFCWEGVGHKVAWRPSEFPFDEVQPAFQPIVCVTSLLTPLQLDSAPLSTAVER